MNQMPINYIHSVCLNPYLAYTGNVVTYTGKGLNLARDLKAFGLDSVVYTFAGGTEGLRVVEMLQADGHKLEYIKIDEPTASIQVTEPNTIKRIRENPSVSTSEIQSLEEKLIGNIKEGDIVVFAGSLPERFDLQKYSEWIRLVNNIGATSVIDTRHNDILSAAIEASPAIIKPNRHEIAAYLNTAAYPTDMLLQELHHQFPNIQSEKRIGAMLLSLDSEGVLLYSNQQVYFCKALDLTPVCTIGAGDSLLAGYLVGEMRWLGTSEKLKLAAAAASVRLSLHAYEKMDAVEVESCMGRMVAGIMHS